MAPQSDLSENEGGDIEEMETPTTPKMGSRHILESTDTTIKQSPAGVAAVGPSQ